MLWFALLGLAQPDVETRTLRTDSPLWLPALFAYEGADGRAVMASGGTTWTASRARGIEASPTPSGFSFATAVSYRRDRAEGPHDTIVGHRGQALGDLLDLTLPPIYRGTWDGYSAHDVDGDGTVDLINRLDDHLVLTAHAGARLVPIPANILALHDREPPYPVPDLNGDGHAELVQQEWVPDPTNDTFTVATLHVFDGGPNGYSPIPRWSLPIDGVLIDLITLQADDDPELELMLLIADRIATFGESLVEVRAITVDAVESGSPVALPHVGTWERWEHRPGGDDDPVIDPLQGLGDLDGDGRDEVLLTGTRERNGDVRLHILGSGSGYDLVRDLHTLYPRDEYFSGIHTLPVHLDLDGELDVVAVIQDVPPTLQVWFGPLVDRLEPPETGRLDTGPRDTGPGDTGPSDTGPTDIADPRPSGPPRFAGGGGCGCASQGLARVPGALLLVAALRRRRPRRAQAADRDVGVLARTRKCRG